MAARVPPLQCRSAVRHCLAIRPPNLRLSANTAARRLYRKLGCAEHGIVPYVFNGIPGVRLVCPEKRMKRDTM